jgi:hypothetical protein
MTEDIKNKDAGSFGVSSQRWTIFRLHVFQGNFETLLRNDFSLLGMFLFSTFVIANASDL